MFVTEKRLVSKLFFLGKGFWNFLDTPSHPRYIFKAPSCGALLFLYFLSVTTNFCVIPFIRRTMETSHVLAKMHLHAHKAKFFTIGPSIGTFSFQQLFAGMEAQQDSVCAAETAAFYRLTDKNE